MTPELFVILAVVGATAVWWLPLLIGAVCWVTASRRVDAILSEEIDQRREAAAEGAKESFDLAVDEAVLLTHEKLADDEETNEDADHFVTWEAELVAEPGIAKHLRRMERWSK